jgi:hypothetical protein
MSKTLSLSALGLLAAGLTLATPEQSHAQGFGVSVNFGRGGFSYYNGRSHDYGYRSPYTGSAFNPYSDSGYSSYRYGYGGYRDPYCDHRPTIVHPESEHWTPRRGWHSHGHIHVPSRYGYRTIPY